MIASCSLVLTLLAQEADKTGNDRYRIKPATLRSWVHRGRIKRHQSGYDLREILKYLAGPEEDHRESA